MYSAYPSGYAPYTERYGASKKEKMYSWRLKRILDVEDDLNHLHICFDREIIDSLVQKIGQTKEQIELPLNSFPIGSPKHLDAGLLPHNKNYKSEITEYEYLTIRLNQSIEIIEISFTEDEAKIELSKEGLKKLLSAIEESKRFAYVYDNFLEAKIINLNSKNMDGKIIIWAGRNKGVVYC